LRWTRKTTAGLGEHGRALLAEVRYVRRLLRDRCT
jgi:hypothetical protein